MEKFVDGLLKNGVSASCPVFMSITIKSRDGRMSILSIRTTLSLVSRQFSSLKRSTKGSFVDCRLTLAQTIDE